MSRASVEATMSGDAENISRESSDGYLEQLFPVILRLKKLS